MEAKINLISIITNNLTNMKNFYHKILGFTISTEMDSYVEFKMNGVRFALTTPDVMINATGDESFNQKFSGHSFELAFDVETPEKVDLEYDKLLSKGVKGIKKPENMPWNQRTAFIADPDGNIHEIFANITINE